MTAADFIHMARCIRLAEKGLYTTDPNPRVGCVLVKHDRVIGEGWHQQAGGPHAEVVALKQAGEAARGATAYVSLEPCCHQGRTGPCTQALMDAGVSRVVAAMEDPNPQVAGRGLALLRQAGIQAECGPMGSQAADLNPGFIKRMTTGLPWVRIKLAMSVDGRTALADGSSAWISGEPSRADVHRWRARASAILTGSATVLRDNPSLNSRIQQPLVQPTRVLLDGRGVIPTKSRLFSIEHPVLWVTGEGCKPHPWALPAHVRHLELPLQGQPPRLPLPRLLKHLGELQINEVMTECGPTLAGALISHGLADELIVYMAPKLMGGDGGPLFWIPPPPAMGEAIKLRLLDQRAFGPDIRFIFKPEVTCLPES